ncbi:MAG: sulfotransferase [Candidatus Nanopelagicaceae bacterium]
MAVKGGFFSKPTDEKSNIKKFYFMAGLPRSGSTLLSSLLNQNPRFYSGPSSPIVGLIQSIENNLNTNELFIAYPKVQQAQQIMSSVIHQYYSDVLQPVVIDKNRAWTNHIDVITRYINQEPKIICPVRDIDEILTSMITMVRRNPYKEGQPKINFVDEMLVRSGILINDDNRCEMFAGPNGILGQSLKGIMDVIDNGMIDNMHFVEYKDLTDNPQETMNKIYEFLGEEPYEHQFEGIGNVNRENDLNVYGIADMHEVRSKLEVTSPNPKDVLSEKTLSKCQGMDIWRQNNNNK